MTTFAEFWRDPPGQRFRRHYYARRGSETRSMNRVLRMFCGGVLVIVGAVFLFLPGPGIPPLVFGAALIASESLSVAKWLDAAEMRLRHWRK